MHRYGYRSPQEVNTTLSRAAVYVLGEAIFWNTYTPPPTDPGEPASPLIQSLGIAVREVG
ncbi:hypothetical protein D3C86_1791640 [compost metagenome]